MSYVFLLAGNVIRPCTFTDTKVMWDVVVFQLAGNVIRPCTFTDMKVLRDVIRISASRKCDTTMYIY